MVETAIMTMASMDVLILTIIAKGLSHKASIRNAKTLISIIERYSVLIKTGSLINKSGPG